MQIISYKINIPSEKVMSVLKDNNLVVEGLNYNGKKGIPKMHVNHKDNKLKIQCEFTGRPTKDNDFLGGTCFHGRIYEKEDTTYIKGIVLTAPIYHFVLFLLFAYFIFKCISLGAISIVPICIVIFSILVFKDEFSKQAIIKKYIFRALKITYNQSLKKSTK